MFSYCHTVAFSANMKGLKAAPVNRPTRKKKTACMPHSITGTHFCSFPRTILLPFGLHNSQKYPQHPSVASKRKSTKQNIPCKRKKKKKACKVAFSSNKQTPITNPSVHFGFVLLKTQRKKERETAYTKCPHPSKAHFFFNKGHKSQLLVHPLSKRKRQEKPK